MTGRVQGVGFRPFVYRLAHELKLDGFVRNLRGDVEIVSRGAPMPRSTRFARDVVERAPPLARPVLRRERDHRRSASRADSQIAASAAIDNPQISVPPDYFCCPDCLAELADRDESSAPLCVHQLHAVRSALHADRGLAVRPAEHDDGGIRALRRLPRGV